MRSNWSHVTFWSAVRTAQRDRRWWEVQENTIEPWLRTALACIARQWAKLFSCLEMLIPLKPQLFSIFMICNKSGLNHQSEPVSPIFSWRRASLQSVWTIASWNSRACATLAATATPSNLAMRTELAIPRARICSELWMPRSAKRTQTPKPAPWRSYPGRPGARAASVYRNTCCRLSWRAP